MRALGSLSGSIELMKLGAIPQRLRKNSLISSGVPSMAKGVDFGKNAAKGESLCAELKANINSQMDKPKSNRNSPTIRYLLYLDFNLNLLVMLISNGKKSPRCS